MESLLPPAVFIFKPRADWVIIMIQFPLLCWKLRGNFYDFDATIGAPDTDTITYLVHNQSGDILALCLHGASAWYQLWICVQTNTLTRPPLASNVLAQLPVFVLTQWTVQCLTDIKTRINFDETVTRELIWSSGESTLSEVVN